MKLIIPDWGNVEYVETPLELAWVDAVTASGMKLEELEVGDWCDDDPIFTRHAIREGKYSLVSWFYRWFDMGFRDDYHLKNPESSRDNTIRYFAGHIDDAEHTYELVKFDRPEVMGFNLFFRKGVLDNVDDEYGNISLSELLQRNGITGVEGKDDLALLQDAIKKSCMDYTSIFKLFMNPEAIVRRREGEQDAASY